MKETVQKDTWYRYVCYFFIFCIVGWIYEVCWEFYVGNGFVNRGYLHGFYLPVYGFGGILLLFSLKKLINKKHILMPFAVFLSVLLIVSVVEYITGYAMEKIYNKRWWDYSYDKFNLHGRISLRNSSLLAIGGMFYLYILYPFLKRFFNHISDKVLKISAIAIVVIMTLDFISVVLGF